MLSGRADHRFNWRRCALPCVHNGCHSGSLMLGTEVHHMLQCGNVLASTCVLVADLIMQYPKRWQCHLTKLIVLCATRHYQALLGTTRHYHYQLQLVDCAEPASDDGELPSTFECWRSTRIVDNAALFDEVVWGHAAHSDAFVTPNLIHCATSLSLMMHT